MFNWLLNQTPKPTGKTSVDSGLLNLIPFIVLIILIALWIIIVKVIEHKSEKKNKEEHK